MSVAVETREKDEAGSTLCDPRLIVALDLPSRADAESMVERLGDAVSFYKVGLQLLATGGMAMAKDLKTRGRQIFLDWKLHDIGATVEKATAAIVATGACDFLTVHAEPQVLAAAVRGRAGAVGVKILGVTVLTSLSEADLKLIGYGEGVEALVERRIRQALDAGADGVVASPHEAARGGWSDRRPRCPFQAPAISAAMLSAAARGSLAAVTGRPQTRWLAPAARASAGVAARA